MSSYMWIAAGEMQVLLRSRPAQMTSTEILNLFETERRRVSYNCCEKAIVDKLTPFGALLVTGSQLRCCSLPSFVRVTNELKP